MPSDNSRLVVWYRQSNSEVGLFETSNLEVGTRIVALSEVGTSKGESARREGDRRLNHWNRSESRSLEETQSHFQDLMKLLVLNFDEDRSPH